MLEIVTDTTWRTVNGAPVVELGPSGMAPWGQVAIPVPQPEYYCDFETVAGVLSEMNVPPDFASAGPFRYIHRRAGQTDIYFVANRANAWQHAECVFRVADKVPEVWDPLTGQIERPAVYRQDDGRTHLPLALEPTGSRFVVFRDELPKLRVATVRRNEGSILPDPEEVIEEQPAARLFVSRGGALKMVVRKAGRCEVRTSEGKTTTVNVKVIPSVRSISTPWDIRFESGRGAPEEIELDELIDLSTHDSPGVKLLQWCRNVSDDVRLDARRFAGMLLSRPGPSRSHGPGDAEWARSRHPLESALCR